jgi:hypothetical protein
VRLRRKVIELLHNALQKRPFFPEDDAAQESAVLAAVAQRCTDQDADVRRVAFTWLNSVQFSKLLGTLPIRQWRRIFEEGLEADCSAAEGAGARQTREIFSAAKGLVEKYLRQDDESNEDADENENSNQMAENKAVHRLHELLASTTAGLPNTLMATLAEILTASDLTCAI